jgi:hypothetical protein
MKSDILTQIAKKKANGEEKSRVKEGRDRKGK